MMQRWTPWVAALAMVLTGIEAVPDETRHVSLVPWKVLEAGDDVRASLVLYWVPASREELRHSDLLTSEELTLYSSQCVAMRVVRFDDWPMLDKLDIEGQLPVAVLADATGGRVIARVDSKEGALVVDDVEAMVRDEIDRRTSEADELLDHAREKADAGETDDAIALYRLVWERRCVCPRQARDAQRALKRLKAN